MRKLLNEYGKMIISMIILFAVVSALVGGIWLYMVGDSLDMKLKNPSNVSLKNADKVSYATLKPYIEVESTTLQIGDSIKLKSLIKAYKPGNADDEYDEDEESNGYDRIDDEFITVTCNSASYNKSSDIFTAETNGSFLVNYKVKTTATIDDKLQNVIGYASTTIIVDTNDIQDKAYHTLNISDGTVPPLKDAKVEYRINNNSGPLLTNESKIKAGTKVYVSHKDLLDSHKYTQTKLTYTTFEKIKKEIIFNKEITSFLIPSDISVTSNIVLEYQYIRVPTMSTSVSDTEKESGIESWNKAIRTKLVGIVNSNDITRIIFSNEQINEYDDYMSKSGKNCNFSDSDNYPIYAKLITKDSEKILSFHSKTGTFTLSATCDYMFRDFTNLKYITCSDNKTVNFNNVTSAEGMFSGCKSLKTIDFGFDYSYSSGLPYQNIAHINFPKLKNATNMFKDCYNLQVFDMTGCKNLYGLPGIGNCVQAKKLIIEYKAVNKMNVLRCMSYDSGIQKFGMSLYPGNLAKNSCTDKIINNYNLKNIDDNENRFEIKVINYGDSYKGSDETNEYKKNGYYQSGTLNVNSNVDSNGKKNIVSITLPNMDEDLKNQILKLYEDNNYFSHISLDYNDEKCSECEHVPMVDYLEKYTLYDDNIDELQYISADTYNCPNCETEITHSVLNTDGRIFFKNNIRYVCSQITVTICQNKIE